MFVFVFNHFSIYLDTINTSSVNATAISATAMAILVPGVLTDTLSDWAEVGDLELGASCTVKK